jgi:sugar phosphate isomerase/epimerase
MMQGWNIGLSTGCCWNASIFELLPDIRNSGFDCLEICSHPGHLDYHDIDLVRRAAEVLRSLQLCVHSFHAPFKEFIDITSFDHDARALARNELVQALNAAAVLGANFFVVHPGPERTAFPDHERFGRLSNAVSVLDEISRECLERGPRLVLENMLPHLFAGRTENLLWILETMKNKQDVGICIDTGHAFLGRELANVVRLFADRLWMVHASDNNGHWDDHLPPGDGQIDWPRFVQELEHNQFSGALILEIAGPDNRTLALERATRGRAYLRRLMTSVPAGPKGSLGIIGS